MKNLVFILLITAILFSCSTVDDPTLSEDEICSEKYEIGDESFPQTWKLVKMTGSMMNSETTGDEMGWHEVILLNSGSTFTKTRKHDNKITEASGTYTMETSLGGDPEYIGLILSYPSESALIGSCYSKSLQETYILKSKCKLVGTWNACDGPGLEYARQITIID